jgi:hypothetical protein
MYNSSTAMDGLLAFTQWSGLLLLLCFLAIVIWKLLSDEISMAGLLESADSDGRRSFSPARAQLLIFTLVVAARCSQ